MCDESLMTGNDSSLSVLILPNVTVVRRMREMMISMETMTRLARMIRITEMKKDYTMKKRMLHSSAEAIRGARSECEAANLCQRLE